MIPGGIADKLGNDYEAHWTVVQALRVLHGHLDEIRLEAFDEDATGFEFRLSRGQAHAWHQCKRRRTSGSWTMRALETEGVLAAFARKLADPHNSCVFISADNAQALKTLTEKAGLVGDTAAFLASLADGDKLELKALQTVWGADDATSYGWLKRCRVETVSAMTLIEQAESLCAMTFTAPPPDCRKAIADHVESQLTRTVRTEAFREALAGLGWRARYDPTLSDRLAGATDDYLSTLTPPAPDTVVVTPSHDAAVEAALHDQAPLVVVAGAAGGGKSLVMARIVAGAREQGRPVLAFRIDRFLSAQTLDALGEAVFGRRESPVLALGDGNGDRDTLLLIDQVDAVSEASGRSSRIRDQVFRMIENAAFFPRMRVVLACRTYDLEHDRRLSGQVENPRCKAVTLTPLDWETGVEPVLARLGLDARAYSSAERRVLTTPINLQLLAQLRAAGQPVDGELSAARLFDLLLVQRPREFRDIGLAWTPAGALGAMAEHMSANQELIAPEAVLGALPGSVEHLSSAGLITAYGGKLQFAHESFFDHAFSSRFVASGASVLELLRSDEQRLFRRTQVRQIFSRLRDLGGRKYLTNLAEVMEAVEVRYLVKDEVAIWLRALASPTDAERKIVERWLEPSHPNVKLARTVFSGPGWTPVLVESGLVRRWLDAAETTEFALWILRVAAELHADVIAPLLRDWWTTSPDRLTALLDWFKILHPEDDIGPLADLYADLVAAIPAETLAGQTFWNQFDIGMWTHKTHPLGVWLLDLWLAKWQATVSATEPFEGDDTEDAEHWLGELATTHPVPFVEAVTPRLARALAVDQACLTAGEAGHPSIRVSPDRDLGEGLLAHLETAMALAAVQDPIVVGKALDLLGLDGQPVLLLHLAAIAAAPEHLAHRLPPLIAHPGVFAVGYVPDAWRPVAAAAQASWPYLGLRERAVVEAAIHGHTPELDAARAAAPDRGRASRWPHRRHVMWDLAHAGQIERAILDTIGAGQLSVSARARLAELNRKFSGQPHPTDTTGGGFVESPIPDDRLVRLSDAQWLSAMAHYTDDGGHVFLKTRVIGGARQLASALGQLVKSQPERFTALLETMPTALNRQYAEAILHGVGESTADGETVVRAIKAARRWTAADLGRYTAWAVRRQPEAARDEAIFTSILDLAEAGKANDTAVRSVDKALKAAPTVRQWLKGEPDAASNGLNEERGAAYFALQSVLWELPDHLAAIVALLDRRLEAEPLTSVRQSMLGAINSVARHAPETALALLARIARRDPIALLGGQAARVLAWAKHQDGFSPTLIPDLIGDDRPSLAVLGLALEGSLALIDDPRAAGFTARLADPLARQVAAFLASGHVPAGAPRDRAFGWLADLWNDPDPTVRAETTSLAWTEVLQAGAQRRPALLDFIASDAFCDQPDRLLRSLQGWVASVPDVAMATVRRILQQGQDAGTRHRSRPMISHYLGRTLVELYRAVEGDVAQERELLDHFDAFLASDLHDVRSQISAYERR